ncbi:MAG: hypothetical protein AABW59_00030 [archaeon]
MEKIDKKNRCAKSHKILFLDIDGVLTDGVYFKPGVPPVIAEASMKVLKEAQKKGFKMVFITARAADELRINGGLEALLEKHGILKDSLVYASSGLDYVTHDYEFKTKNHEVIFKDGSAVLEIKPVIKRESFGSLDKYLLSKNLLGKEIKQQLKFRGFKILPAISERITTDARIFFELENNTKEERLRAVEETQKVCDFMYEAFKKTGKYGSPVELGVWDIEAGISIEPRELGKHIGVLRAIKRMGISLDERLIGYAFGDSATDAKMKIRKDIEFVRVKDHKNFLNILKKELEKY